MKIYRSLGYEQKHRLVFIAYVFEGLSCNSGLIWDHGAPINGKTTNSFSDTEDLSAFLTPIFSFQLVNLMEEQECN